MAEALPQQPALSLSDGLQFEDLYRDTGLARIDAVWTGFLRTLNASLADRFEAARRAPGALEARAHSALLIELGPVLDAFLARLFNIGAAHTTLQAAHHALDPLFRVKWKFVKRQALLGVSADALIGFDAEAARSALQQAIRAHALSRTVVLSAQSTESPAAHQPDDAFDELAFAQAVLAWQADAATHADTLQQARLYCAWAVTTPQGRARHPESVLFRHPESVDPFDRLDHTQATQRAGVQVLHIRPEALRRRLDGARAPFALTDTGTALRGALDEARYCLLCHEQGRDACSKGLLSDATPPALKRSAFGEPLAGCPLGERISEFQALKREGWPISALAMIVVDNPMAAATGHRICNDCVKACVYQHQTPVDIPQAETRTLRDVLELPWGVEIYSLLTRWNPLNLRRPLPTPDSGKKVLVVGMGPAGFTLAHHLLNDGHTVVAIDGLKIEPMQAALGGRDAHGMRVPFVPVHTLSELIEPLDARVMAGFGGVAEYGITVRWDKNFLTIVRLLLERRERFGLIGGVRFGGTLTVDEAWAQGFDHIALAMGAGRPTMLNIPNGLARGVRAASDFLMALQLTGAARSDSIANLQVRLPAVVVGGGLTAIDTATETLAYYVAQADKMLARHEALVRTLGEATVRSGWSDEECSIADELFAHGRAIRAEREAAHREARPARISELLDAWGGVTVVYRKRLIDSPAYTLNPQEVQHALAEGIRIAECLAPERIEVDAHGAVRAIVLRPQVRHEDGTWSPQAGAAEDWPVRTVLIAAGTQPNTGLADEDPIHAVLDGRHFRALNESGQPISARGSALRTDPPAVLMHGAPGERCLSFFGDLHPAFAGNVVKAMASAAKGWPVISRVLAQRAPASREGGAAFIEHIQSRLQARVVSVDTLAPGIVEVIVHAPAAAARFEPGQFYRLQNFESLAPRVAGPDGTVTRLAMEGLALTGAWVDRQAGLVSTIVLEMGGSSNLCRQLQPGEPVVLMGPTGTPTEIPSHETVVLAGGGLGNAVLFSIGAALRAAGSRVLYFAGYKRIQDRYKVAEIEAAADVVVWCCDEAPGFRPGRPQDRAFQGNIVQAMLAWAQGEPMHTGSGAPDHGPRGIGLHEADRLIAIGSDRMMAAVARARCESLAAHLKPGHRGIGSINSPMQCMLKGLCGQCLQPQTDPSTGRTELVFSCAQQDQPLEAVDFPALDQRLRQNSLQEKLTARWLAQLTGDRPAAG